MNLFEIDFDDDSDGTVINDDDFASMTAQADVVIQNEKENSERRAEACVKKFQLLETRYKLAPKLLEKALKLYPDMPQALTNLGRFYLYTKNREKAVEYFDKAAEADPSYPYVWLEKAKFGKDREEVLRFYSEFIRLKPDSKTGYEKRAQLYEENILCNEWTRVQEAINDYSELIRLDPSNWRYYERRAGLRIMMSKTNPCINHDVLMDIEQLLLLYPEDDTYNCITIAHNLFAELTDKIAIECIKRIIDDMPLDSIGQFIAKILLANRCDYEEAIEIYSEIINSLKDEDLLRFYCFHQRAQSYLMKEEFEKALADNDMIIKHGSALKNDIRYRYRACDPYYARENKAGIYEEMKDFTGAINEYTLLLEELNLDKTEDKYSFSSIYFRRAWVFRKNGEYDKALADYSAVIDLGINGFDFSVRKAYASRIDIYKARGEMDKAFADYIKMSELKEEDDSWLVLDAIVPQKFEILDE